MTVQNDDEAVPRAAVLASIARQLRRVASAEEIATLLTAAGAARNDKALAVVLEAVEAIASGTTTKATSAVPPTFASFAEDWTSKRLHKLHPDHVRDKDETEDVQQLRDYINPHLGHLRLPDVTLDDVERVMRKLPATLGPRTRRHVAQCVRKVLSLAVYPGRHIVANPIPREWMPKIPKSANKAKACLYPDEDAKLCSCPAVLLERRIAYGILMREGMRASELAQLHFGDVDLERGRIRLDENKTDKRGRGRSLALECFVRSTTCYPRCVATVLARGQLASPMVPRTQCQRPMGRFGRPLDGEWLRVRRSLRTLSVNGFGTDSDVRTDPRRRSRCDSENLRRERWDRFADSLCPIMSPSPRDRVPSGHVERKRGVPAPAGL